MSGQYLMGIDKGTTVTKVVIFDPEGHELGARHYPTRLLSPSSGWAEEEPGASWVALRKAIREVLDGAGVTGSAVVGIGCTATMGGAWLLDAEGRELRNGITWTDQRAASLVGEWRRTGVAERAFELGGNALLAGFTLVLVRWLAENESDTLARARHVLCAKDWMRFKLTGRVATDETDLSWMPGDPFERTYSEELFELLGIVSHRPRFPEPKPSEAIAGELLPEVAAELGLVPGTPVAVGMGDALAGHYGLGALDEGQAATIIGTALINGLTISRPVLEPMGIGFHLCTVGGRWVRMMNNTGGGNVNLNWFLEALCEPERQRAQALGVSVFEVLEDAVEKVPLGANGVVFHPYANPAGVVAPFYNPNAAANFFGIRTHNTRADLLRAVYEGVALATHDCFSAVPVSVERLRLAGGGARSEFWCQMIADCTGTTCEVTEGQETTARGAAMLAGVAAGVFSDYRDAAKRAIEVKRAHRPDQDQTSEYRELYEVYREVRRGLDGAWSLRGNVYSKLHQSTP